MTKTASGQVPSGRGTWSDGMGADLIVSRDTGAFPRQSEPTHKLRSNVKRKGVSRKEETGENYSRKGFCNLKRKIKSSK